MSCKLVRVLVRVLHNSRGVVVLITTTSVSIFRASGPALQFQVEPEIFALALGGTPFKVGRGRFRPLACAKGEMIRPVSRSVAKKNDWKVENDAELRLLRNLRGLRVLITVASVSIFGARILARHFQLDPFWFSSSPPEPKANYEVASDQFRPPAQAKGEVFRPVSRFLTKKL